MKKMYLMLIVSSLLFFIFIVCEKTDNEKTEKSTNCISLLQTEAEELLKFWDGKAGLSEKIDSCYNLRLFYPLPFGKVFHFIDPANPAVVNAILSERWGEIENQCEAYEGNFTFTNHNIYYPNGSDWHDYWCPRVDDVFSWNNDKLYYSDTYSFYTPAHHTNLSPAHIWADKYMIVGNVFSQIVTHSAKNLLQENCMITGDGDTLFSHPYTHIFRALAVETTDWSPYTGGESNPVAVVRLDEATYIRDTPDAPYDNFFKEEWSFTLVNFNGLVRFIPIHSLGYHQNPDGSRVGKWNMRLDKITDF